ncbi:MAG: hypothetical protein EA369_09505 [Bradymonadales bacterium]|nr:MAG: hypothetical protein EA369_09505 [Bradymonadales bacterium]
MADRVLKFGSIVRHIVCTVGVLTSFSIFSSNLLADSTIRDKRLREIVEICKKSIAKIGATETIKFPPPHEHRIERSARTLGFQLFSYDRKTGIYEIPSEQAQIARLDEIENIIKKAYLVSGDYEALSADMDSIISDSSTFSEAVRTKTHRLRSLLDQRSIADVQYHLSILGESRFKRESEDWYSLKWLPPMAGHPAVADVVVDGLIAYARKPSRTPFGSFDISDAYFETQKALLHAIERRGTQSQDISKLQSALDRLEGQFQTIVIDQRAEDFKSALVQVRAVTADQRAIKEINGLISILEGRKPSRVLSNLQARAAILAMEGELPSVQMGVNDETQAPRMFLDPHIQRALYGAESFDPAVNEKARRLVTIMLEEHRLMAEGYINPASAGDSQPGEAADAVVEASQLIERYNRILTDIENSETGRQETLTPPKSGRSWKQLQTEKAFALLFEGNWNELEKTLNQIQQRLGADFNFNEIQDQRGNNLLQAASLMEKDQIADKLRSRFGSSALIPSMPELGTPEFEAEGGKMRAMLTGLSIGEPASTRASPLREPGSSSAGGESFKFSMEHAMSALAWGAWSDPHLQKYLEQFSQLPGRIDQAKAQANLIPNSRYDWPRGLIVHYEIGFEARQPNRDELKDYLDLTNLGYNGMKTIYNILQEMDQAGVSRQDRVSTLRNLLNATIDPSKSTYNRDFFGAVESHKNWGIYEKGSDRLNELKEALLLTEESGR